MKESREDRKREREGRDGREVESFGEIERKTERERGGMEERERVSGR